MMLSSLPGTASAFLAFAVFAPVDSCHAQSSQPGITAPGAAQSSPYVGQEKRTIKSLSDQEVADILVGKGVGLARPAELNHYPGPLHVLQFKEQLGLTADQTERVQAIFDRMSRDAKALGKEWIDRERALEADFAASAISADQVSAQTIAIGELQGTLRAVHLTAHVATRAVLTPEQIAKYDVLRGYQAAATPNR
jgi:Spy/CpxP family protein refolding chaperone